MWNTTGTFLKKIDIRMGTFLREIDRLARGVSPYLKKEVCPLTLKKRCVP
jgi:hypothetical protein